MREVYCGLDSETTGTEVDKGHGLIQIGIHAEDGFAFVSDVDPGPEVVIDDEAMGINKFTPERIMCAPNAEYVDSLLEAAIVERYGQDRFRFIAVGWNVGSFDLPFVKKYLPRLYKRLSYRTVDLNAVTFTIDRARRGMKGVLRYDGLKKNAKEYAVSVLCAKGIAENWHDAYYDARAGMLAWEYLQKKVMVTD